MEAREEEAKKKRGFILVLKKCEEVKSQSTSEKVKSTRSPSVHEILAGASHLQDQDRDTSPRGYRRFRPT